MELNTKRRLVKNGMHNLNGRVYNKDMTDRLKELIKRTESWPEEAQQEAIQALQDIEEDFVIGPETRKELDESHRQAMRGEGIEMEELFKKYGL